MKKQTTVTELIWVREQLRLFTKLEREIRKEIGKYGIQKEVIMNPLIMVLFIFSILMLIIGVYFWSTEKNDIFLLSFIPISITCTYIFNQIKKEKKKNIYRFIGKNNIPNKIIIKKIEEYVFNEKDKFDEIIAWKINKGNVKDKQKYINLFEKNYWTDIKKAQLQCLILAILMVSIQKHLHENRLMYERRIKNVAKPAEVQKPIENNFSEMQTVSGFTTEDLFH